MRLDGKIALGIDVSETLISLALLKKDGNGVKLLRAASGPVPAGAIKEGKIENAAILAKAIGRLKNRVSMRTTRAAVSLFAEPTIVQIMDMPRQVPSNVRNFIQEQVKHFAVLLAKKIDLDFCAVSGVNSEASAASRVLTVATDGRRVAELVEMYKRAGVSAEAIEPPLLGCIRALYAGKIEGKFDSNVLIAVLRDNSLSLCVFRRQIVDFVRTRDLSEENAGSDELCQWVAGQINMVVQSYEAQTQRSCDQWEVTIVADRAQLPEDAEEQLRANVAGANLQMLTGEDICRTAVVSQSHRFNNRRGTDTPSATAIGLAMKLLDPNAFNLGVNLLPAEATRLRATQRGALVTANIIAAVSLIMMLAVAVPIWKIRKLNESIRDRKAHLLQSTQSLVERRELLDERINTICDKLNRVNKILDSRHDTYWPGLLSEIARNRPKTVCVTDLSSGADSQMSLKGLAISNEDVYLFVDVLNKSEHIESASILQTKKDKDYDGLVSFEIRCSLVARKGA